MTSRASALREGSRRFGLEDDATRITQAARSPSLCISSEQGGDMHLYEVFINAKLRCVSCDTADAVKAPMASLR